MEQVDLTAASFDTLRRLRRPTSSPTREEIEDLRSSGIVWLKWTPSLHQNDQDNNTTISAMELLARLRLYSYELWIALVSKLWRDEISYMQRLLGARSFQLGVEFATSDPDLFTKFCPTFLRYGRDDCDQEGALDHGEGTPGLDISIPVRLSILGTTHFSTGPFNELWQKACELVEAARDLASLSDTDTTNPITLLYRIVDVKTSKFSAGRWSADDVMTFHRLASCGVRVWCPLEPNKTWIAKGTAPRLIKPLQELLATQAPPLPNESFRALSSIGVSLLSDHQLLDSVFSATMASRSIREVAVRDPSVMRRGSRERAWQWLAVVLRLPIETFTLDCQNLLIDDINVLEASLNAANPLAVLFPSTTDLVASASRFRLHSPPRDLQDASDTAEVFCCDPPLENLLVVGVDDETDGWVTVLLPGWGRAWVLRTDASLASALTWPQMTVGPQHISLTNLLSDQGALVLAFLQQVGQHVHKVSLSSSKRHETHVNVSSILDSVFLACPHLDELQITEMALPSLEILSQFFRNGQCQVKHLVLEDIHIDDKSSSTLFFDHLTDVNHPMTKHLRTLSCTVKERVEFFPTIQLAALRALQLNHRLYEFQLEVGDVRYALRLDDSIPMEVYDHFNGERIIDRLASPSKLAFLSVVLADGDSTKLVGSTTIVQPEQLCWLMEILLSWWATQPSYSQSAIHLLDRDVLSTIFQFAGVVHTRCVRVQFC